MLLDNFYTYTYNDIYVNILCNNNEVKGHKFAKGTRGLCGKVWREERKDK